MHRRLHHPTGPPRADSTAPVLAPGRPGEQARTLSPGEAATAVPSGTPNAADVKYVQDMVVHHRQAVDMALLAPPTAPSRPSSRRSPTASKRRRGRRSPS
ncbi:DUF305 domain-containing protein [Nonomuraea salmonea]|uniref:DUF305 domain-containing protein n=1 Tax=Nonomuraea salmonea TaxID=46181 RepID=UPI0031E7A9F7